MTRPPIISVLMPVYNGALYLKQAIESILVQSYSNFEFIIVNDGSTDTSEAVVNEFKDKRIRYVLNEKNLGLVASLNIGIALAAGKYIARMDQDDIADANRLQVQYDFLEQNTDTIICGTAVMIIGTLEMKYAPLQDAEIRVALLFGSPFYHPTVMMRKSTLITNNLKFSEANKHAEDYGFWIDLASCGKLANLTSLGLHYRKHATQYSQTFHQGMASSAAKSRHKYITQLGVRLSLDESSLFEKMVLQRIDWSDDREFLQTRALCKSLPHYFINSTLDPAILRQYIWRMWRACLMARQKVGLYSYGLFLTHSEALKLNEIKVHLWFWKQIFYRLIGINIKTN